MPNRPRLMLNKPDKMRMCLSFTDLPLCRSKRVMVVVASYQLSLSVYKQYPERDHHVDSIHKRGAFVDLILLVMFYKMIINANVG